MMTCAMLINEGLKLLYSFFKFFLCIIFVRVFIVDVYGMCLGIVDVNACECCICKRVFVIYNGLVMKIVVVFVLVVVKMCVK